jgi:hypothetical protein
MAISIVAAGAGEDPTPHAPPVAADCLSSLRASGARFSEWAVRPTLMPTATGRRILCEVPSGLSLIRGGTGLRYQPRARVNCTFGLRLARFEEVLQVEAKLVLRSRVTKIEQLGTYNCRKMAAYPDLVSEHSFANAIDVSVFVLANGQRVVVERDWVPADRTTTKPAALFLRRLTRRLFDEQIFSVVLTPSYDRHHRNHLHLDGADYFVDGT